MDRKILLVVALLVTRMVVSGMSYEDAHCNSEFFSEVQEWVLHKYVGVEGESAVTVNVKVEGDVTVKGKYEVEPGFFMEGNVLCKRLEVSEADAEPIYLAAFEEENKIYVFSEKLHSFVIVADFNATQGELLPFNGEEWSVSRLDYIYPDDVLRMRVKLTSGDSDVTQVYGIGISRYSAADNCWDNPAEYCYVSCIMSDGGVVDKSVFDIAAFVPTNTYYTIGKMWKEYTFDRIMEDEPNMSEILEISVVEDIEFANMNCRKLRSVSSRFPGESFSIGCDYNGKVYRFDEESRRFRLAMDFNLEVGDLAYPADPMSEVVSVDYVGVNGAQCKRIAFKGAEGEDQMWRYWVEGVGASDNNYMYPVVMPVGWSRRMEECYDGEDLIFTYNDFSAPSGICRIFGENETTDDVRIYDLVGRRFSEPLSPGIYVRDGSKFIVR